MNKEALQMVFDKLDAIAVKLGTTVDLIWPWFIKQQYVEFAALSAGLVLGGMALFFFVKFTIKHWYADEGFSISYHDLEPLFIIIGLASCFLFLVGCAALISSLPTVFNPEYYALQSLIQMIK